MKGSNQRHYNCTCNVPVVAKMEESVKSTSSPGRSLDLFGYGNIFFLGNILHFVTALLVTQNKDESKLTSLKVGLLHTIVVLKSSKRNNPNALIILVRSTPIEVGVATGAWMKEKKRKLQKRPHSPAIQVPANVVNVAFQLREPPGMKGLQDGLCFCLGVCLLGTALMPNCWPKRVMRRRNSTSDLLVIY